MRSENFVTRSRSSANRSPGPKQRRQAPYPQTSKTFGPLTASSKAWAFNKERLRDLYDSVNADDIRGLAHQLIDLEHDLKYRKKYASLWR
jgi:hypothetical protein